MSNPNVAMNSENQSAPEDLTCVDTERAGLYAFQFEEPSGNTALVAMGNTATNALGAGTLSARNLRSYSMGWCDELNWAFWIANSWAH